MSGLTPITLTDRLPAVIRAPSKVIMLRTPVILRSLVDLPGSQALRGDDQQVRQDDLAERAGGSVAVRPPGPVAGWAELELDVRDSATWLAPGPVPPAACATGLYHRRGAGVGTCSGVTDGPDAVA